MTPKVTIYCDGACLGNPGPGGFAALLMLDNTQQERVVCGYEISTTNNRMELKAALSGLLALKKKCHVEIYSDSQYVVKGMTEWIHNWRRSGFKNSQKKEVVNADLWKELFEAAQKHRVTWKWVRGHAGNELNERVDEIAREQAGLALHSLHGV
ncbi:MAG: ribonuclease HI [Myxococcales bacterium]|nr:MAG: ribonuclease HI [Myxococcales bacterium]